MGTPSSNDQSQKPPSPVTQVKSTPDHMETLTDQERDILFLKSMAEQQLRRQQSASVRTLTWDEFMEELLNKLSEPKRLSEPDIQSRL
ncbi:uncharacterized protein FTJAE_1670 [Fusarium tjaetaba]|uniref:Uncharacterized protein n=1 Tax=Fusarium tjaetaba TaxID=1567544 RepID=A0A8H5W7A3_9HYPO|nr:uncharacterized protein FTJAE_1670 [Fusarium tjaetaba]KAF5647614.1 hypothetical protein FTJAE_1670 [Fusarium tjaetaba]